MNAEQKQRAVDLIDVTKTYRLDAEECAMQMAALLQELVDAPEPEPVAWMVKNGFVCSMIYQSKKDADNYAADQQKRHDLSGSLASFCVIPLYTAPPEPKPVARVTGYYAGYLSIETVDGRVLSTGTALYTAPPAPSVPDGWIKHIDEKRPAGLADNCIVKACYRNGEELEARAAYLCWRHIYGDYDIVFYRLSAPTPAEAPADVARWIDPNDKTQKQFLPHIGERVLFCHDGRTYYGKHTGGSFISFTHPGKTYPTWGCHWMYPPKATDAAIEREKMKGGEA